jgi:retron-type reverse transcriptase
LHPTEEGTPQGGIASPVLANLALDGLERRLKEQCPTPHGETAERRQVHMVRYADGTPVQAYDLWGASPLPSMVRSEVSQEVTFAE